MNKYLYHYTNVGVLALILKNRTIRFNSLDRMDDRQEEKTADLENVGQFCYVSAWTEDEEESIPMWNMYASLDYGVRIRLKCNPFKLYNIDSECIIKDSGTDYEARAMKTIIPFSEMKKGKFIVLNCDENSPDFLQKVKYTSKDERLLPRLKGYNNETMVARIRQLGRYKNRSWSFQKEWRYVIYAIPHLWDTPETEFKSFDDFCKEMILGHGKQPVDYFELKIDDEAFREMEVTLSPCIKNGYRIIAHDLVEKYNPDAKINESILHEQINSSV